MSENLVDLAVTQFSANLELKVQQMSSRLRGRVAEGSHRGKQAAPVQYLAPIKARSPEGRFAPKARVDAEFERRWVFPVDREFDQYIDTFDELRVISDPKAQYSTNAAAAVGRDFDDILIDKATADASIGTDINGLSTETFDSSTYGVAVDYGASAATGLTVAKLIELKRLIRHYATDGNPDNEIATLVIGSQQEADMLGQVQFVSTEYNDRPVLVNGEVKKFLGFDIIVMERLSVASSVRDCLAILKSGHYLGIWKDMTNSASIRYDLSSQPWDLNTMYTIGATRLQKGKLFTVKCSDSTGASIVP